MHKDYASKVFTESVVKTTQLLTGAWQVPNFNDTFTWRHKFLLSTSLVESVRLSVF